MTHPNVNLRGKMMTGHAEQAKGALRQGRPYDDDDRRSCAITWIVRQPCALPEWVWPGKAPGEDKWSALPQQPDSSDGDRRFRL